MISQRYAAALAIAMVMLQFLCCKGLNVESNFEKVLQTIVHGDYPAPFLLPEALELPLDHFNALSANRWSMRYWVDVSHWNRDPETPVFLAMGGEGAAGPPGGQMAELASIHRALLFSIEHRYYGESIPTSDFSTSNLRWLGTEQALADAAFFQRTMVGRYNLSSDSRWITFGGSYSGELAAWARIKYPHLFHAAVASSAPVTARVDFDGYDPIVANALQRQDLGGSEACRDAIANAFNALEKLLDFDRQSLQGLFNTCGPVRTDGDAYMLHDYVSDDFMGLVQYNNVHAAVNIRSRCQEMLNTSLGQTPLERLVAITGERAGKACIYDPDESGVRNNISFAEHLKGYSQIQNPGRSFPYQMCVDGVGHDQTCKAKEGCIFSPKYATRQFFQELCHAAFGASAAQTDAAVAFNSANYGDSLPGGSRIVFVNGDIDPFHWGSVTENSTRLLQREIVALMVIGGSHCQDMGRSDAARDSLSMAQAKRGKAELVAKWLMAAADSEPLLI